MASNTPIPETSAVWRAQWLAACEGFRVEARGRSSRWRIGRVTGIRFGSSGEPELLEVRLGLLSRRQLLIPVERVEEIVPEQHGITLRGAPQRVAVD
jgi:hypothetical protein